MTEEQIIDGLTVEQYRRSLAKDEASDVWSLDGRVLSFASTGTKPKPPNAVVTISGTGDGSWSGSELTDDEMGEDAGAALKRSDDERPLPAVPPKSTSSSKKRPRASTTNDNGSGSSNIISSGAQPPSHKRVKLSVGYPLMNRTLAAISKNPVYNPAAAYCEDKKRAEKKKSLKGLKFTKGDKAPELVASMIPSGSTTRVVSSSSGKVKLRFKPAGHSSGLSNSQVCDYIGIEKFTDTALFNFISCFVC